MGGRRADESRVGWEGGKAEGRIDSRGSHTATLRHRDDVDSVLRSDAAPAGGGDRQNSRAVLQILKETRRIHESTRTRGPCVVRCVVCCGFDAAPFKLCGKAQLNGNSVNLPDCVPPRVLEQDRTLSLAVSQTRHSAQAGTNRWNM